MDVPSDVRMNEPMDVPSDVRMNAPWTSQMEGGRCWTNRGSFI